MNSPNQNNQKTTPYRSIRLSGYDYTLAGAYFVTICAYNRESLFGNIQDGLMHRNKFGDVVQQCWDDLPHHYSHLVLDEFVIMPNHIHGILILENPDRENRQHVGHRPTSTKIYGLPEIIRGFKTFSAKKINESRHIQQVPVWQRNYYDRVVRDEKELNNIRQYILDNPYNWFLDKENPQGHLKKTK